MQINVEDLLVELVMFDRKTADKVKVERMTRVVARAIETMSAKSATPADVIRVLIDETEGHA